MVESLVLKFDAVGIKVDASWVRMRCLPHTIHLSVLEVSCIVLLINNISNQLFDFSSLRQ